MKFRKNEIRRYNFSIHCIREELASGRHIIACLGSAGITFNDDVERFYKYALQIKALDISEEIIKYCNFIIKGDGKNGRN